MKFEKVLNFIENKKFEFRVWDKEFKLMVTEKGFKKILSKIKHFEFEHGKYVYEPDSIFISEINLFKGINLLKEHYGDRFIFMQYVGANDSKNKKLFDGDIIEGEKVIHDGLEPFIQKIKGVVVLTSQGVLVFTPNRTWDLFILGKIKKIGNIYQHPDLLKEIWRE